MSRVFLSHASRDNRQAIALKHWLEQAEPGLSGEIFLDLDAKTGIASGLRWAEALWQANARCEAVVCLLSSGWATSAECRAEYRQAEGMSKPILCARIEAFTEEDVTRAWQRCDLFGNGLAIEIAVDGNSHPVRLQLDGLHRLLAGLRAVGIGADSFTWPPPEDPGRSPYRGWQPLESIDAAVYFGRDAQIVRALDELREMRDTGRERIFVVLGPSGVGKSSFLRAGLLPRLSRDDRRFLPMTVVRPQRRALTGETGLARSIHDLRKQVGLTEPSLGEMKNAISDGPTVRGWLAEAALAAGERILDASASETPPTLVLPLDQAEELFGADTGEEGPALLELLGRLLSDTESNGLDLIVVATIRSDRYEPLQTAPQLSDVQSRLFDRLKAMPEAQFTEVICGPARRAVESGARFELAPQLVERLVQDASGGADTLPLLALTLARLYEDYAGSAGTVTVDRYEAMGGISRVVQNEIDSLLSTDPVERSEQLDRLHDAFIPWLATVNSDTDQPMRRIARWADLPEASHTLLNAFVARRLLVKGERDGQVVVEVALESLLHQWDELSQWLQAEASDLRNADAVERAAAAWERSGRHDDWLLDGFRLATGETLSTRTGFGARLQPVGEFLLASRRRANQKLNDEKSAAEAHARSLRRRSQILVALLAVIVLVAAIAIVSFARAQRAEQRALNEAQQAVAAKLIGQSRAMLGGTRPGGDLRAIQQMLAAETLEPGSDPDSLLNTLVDTRRLLRVIPVPSDVFGVDVSPDGRQVVSAGDDGVVRRWDLESGTQIGEPLTGNTGKGGAEYVNGGRWIASGMTDLSFHVWDADSGAVVRTTGAHADAVSGAMSGDGRLLATGNRDGTVQIWDVASDKQIGEAIHANSGWVTAVAFSPDGTRLVTGGADGAMRMWDVSTHQSTGPALPVHRGSVLDVDFSADGKHIGSMSYFIGSGQSGTTASADPSALAGVSQLRVTDAVSGKPTVERLTESTGVGNDLAISPDGRLVAIGFADGKIYLYDGATGATVGPPLSGHSGAVNAVMFNSDGTRIVSGGGPAIHIWAADPDQSVGRRLPGLASAKYLAVAVSPDGQVVATRDSDNGSNIALRRIDTGELVRTISTGYVGLVTALAWQPDGKTIAAADGNTDAVRMWSAQTGEPAGPPLPGPTKPIHTLSFSADGHHLAALVVDSDPWLWDISASPPRGFALPRGKEDWVASVAFSADGRRLLTVAPIHTSGDDGAVTTTGNVFDISAEITPSAIRVWDTETGEAAGPPIIGRSGRPVEVQELKDEVPIIAGAISPDGQRMLICDMNGVRLYDVNSGRPVGEPWADTSVVVDPLVGLRFSPDGSYVVSVDKLNSALQFRDAQTGRPIGNSLIGHSGYVSNLEFTPDGDHIVSRGLNDGWMLWPGPNRWREELCDKLTVNLSTAEWNQWVSPTIGYRAACPSLSVPGHS